MSPPCFTSTLARRPSALVATLVLGACSPKQAEPARIISRTEWPSPMADASATCSDVGELRVCWGVTSAEGGIVVVARRAPAVVPSRLGFRCHGAGASRACVDRALGAEEFRCDGARCEERHPRLPDAGEWECADIAGAVFCRGGEPPAGAPPGASDPGFIAASRVVKSKASPERLAVDWSPDFPEGQARGYRCHFESTRGMVRVCEKDPSAHSIGDACDRAHPCIEGLVCADTRCVPPHATPTCWLDADCDRGGDQSDQQVCRFGACTTRSP